MAHSVSSSVASARPESSMSVYSHATSISSTHPRTTMSLYSRASTAMTGDDVSVAMQRFNALTVDDLFKEITKTEPQYIKDLRSMQDVPLVKELLVCHCTLEPSLHKILLWAEQAAPIYNRYVLQYELDLDDTEELTYIKRRPLVRLRFFSKLFKKLQEFLPNVNGISKHAATYRALVTGARAKVESEKVRVAKLKIDFSRIRSFDNLQPVASWFNPKFITMRSYCQCHLVHRTGKTFVGLPVEILLVAEPLLSEALAICQLHEFHRYLLFPTFRRADLVYEQETRDLKIALDSYNGSKIELEFSSTDNKNTWATKFSEIFRPSPSSIASPKPNTNPATFSGLHILNSSKDGESMRLEINGLESDSDGPRLRDEPDLSEFIVDTSPQKKRQSVFKYGNNILSHAAQARNQSRNSIKITNAESRLSTISSSSSASSISRSSRPVSSVSNMSSFKRRTRPVNRSFLGIVPSPIIEQENERSPDIREKITKSPELNKQQASLEIPVVENKEKNKEEDDNEFRRVSKKRSIISSLFSSKDFNDKEHKFKEINENGHDDEFDNDNDNDNDDYANQQNSATADFQNNWSASQRLSSLPNSQLAPVNQSEYRTSIARNSVHSDISIVPEIFNSEPRPTIIHHLSPDLSVGSSQFSDAGEDRKGKNGSHNGRTSIGSVFKRLNSRMSSKIEPSTHSGVNNENAVSSMYSRMSSSKHASSILASLSPNLSENSPATSSIEFSNQGSKRSSSGFKGLGISNLGKKNSANKSFLDSAGSESRVKITSDFSIANTSDLITSENSKHSKKLNIFSKSARKARAAFFINPIKEHETADPTSLAVLQASDTVNGVQAFSKEPTTKASVSSIQNQSIISEVDNAINEESKQTSVTDASNHIEQNCFENVVTNAKSSSPEQSLPSQFQTLIAQNPVDINNFEESRLLSTVVIKDAGLSETFNEVNRKMDAHLLLLSSQSDSLKEEDSLPEVLIKIPNGSRLSKSSVISQTSTVRDSNATIKGFTYKETNCDKLGDHSLSDQDEDQCVNISEINVDTEPKIRNEDDESVMDHLNEVSDAESVDSSFSTPVLPLSIVCKDESSSGTSKVGSIKTSSNTKSNKQLSPLTTEYSASSLSSNISSDDNSGSGSEDVSYTVTTPSPTLRSAEDMKIVLFKSNAMVYEWGIRNTWDKIVDEEVKVLVTVLDEGGEIEVWPVTQSKSEVQSSATSICSGSTGTTKSVQFGIGDVVVSTRSDGSQPILTIQLNQQTNIRRSTAFDIHVKRAGGSGVVMFRTRSAVEAEQMVNAMNSCKLEYRGLQARSFSLSAPSIASSESSSKSSLASAKFGNNSIVYHPVIETPNGHSSVIFSNDVNLRSERTSQLGVFGGGETYLVKDIKCSLFLRQNATKWRNIGPAKISVTSSINDMTKKVTVTQPDGRIVFDLRVAESSFERNGRTGIAVHVLDKQSEEIKAVINTESSRVAVYMVQFKGEKEVNLVDKAIRDGSDV
ncbi:hypothetical protein V1514DRAFT_352619 [Lipomyces japonicus]|uniref:uncharacterized protein n=1 Tax=Lipomyces japonicus TaxID=56871 RepID=UPI0034CEEC1A